MKNLTDKELIKSVVENQSQQHFSVLVDRYSEQLYWSIRKVTKNHELTDDALQNTWIKVWNNLSSFKFDAAFFTWIYRIARNETFTILKKESKINTIDTDDPTVYFDQTSSHKDIDGETISKMLDQAVQFLPEKQKLIFELKYFHHKKYKEIAEILEISEGGCKASYFHAVKKVEESLKTQLNLL
jgi:RNA polymerase sigma-70 factor (ECF subfamily)